MRWLLHVLFGQTPSTVNCAGGTQPPITPGKILEVRSWDVIIIGAGIIGLSLALELRKSGTKVLVVEKGQPGREASWAAGGMLADFPLEMPPALHELAAASARMYPDFVQRLESESGLQIDLRSKGTLVFLPPDRETPYSSLHCHPERSEGPMHSLRSAGLQESYPLPAPLSELEPSFTARDVPVLYLKERSVDPRHLTAAAIAAARNQGVDFSADDPVQSLEIENGQAAGVRTAKTKFKGGIVVNCAGAWSAQIHVGRTLLSAQPRAEDTPRSDESHVERAFLPAQPKRSEGNPLPIPTRPVKGQMLCVALPQKNLVRHVVRTLDVYLIPRSNQTMLIGATQEEAGFDKRTVPETILKLRQAAIALVPKLAEARILEDWAGLRPGTPDKLPILGETSITGYYAATGHFRDGILLAPITARVVSQLIGGNKAEFDLIPFAPGRFQHT